MAKVTLRKKKISGNKHSLYLDFYPAIYNPETSKPTRREFLRLYLLDSPMSKADKEHNSEAQNLAEIIRNERNNQLNKIKIPDKTIERLAYKHYKDTEGSFTPEESFIAGFKKAVSIISKAKVL